uniref:Uncharacterized protein n=1 Tax=Romanomermis culicivorax TaxID=13658 RepID=A0A915I9X4_ROMCU
MQIDELDDQWRRHLHRSGAPQKDGNDKSTDRLERRARGPGAHLLTASSGRPTFLIIKLESHKAAFPETMNAASIISKLMENRHISFKEIRSYSNEGTKDLRSSFRYICNAKYLIFLQFLTGGILENNPPLLAVLCNDSLGALQPCTKDEAVADEDIDLVNLPPISNDAYKDSIRNGLEYDNGQAQHRRLASAKTSTINVQNSRSASGCVATTSAKSAVNS